MAKQPRITKVVIKGVEWTPSLVKEKILTSDNALKAALLRLYSWQTEDEKVTQETREANGKGFNGTDGAILSSFAEQLLKRGFLSPKQIAIARKKLPKYSRQIFEHQIVANRVKTYEKFGI